jgi:hypothetical protein
MQQHLPEMIGINENRYSCSEDSKNNTTKIGFFESIILSNQWMILLQMQNKEV